MLWSSAAGKRRQSKLSTNKLRWRDLCRISVSAEVCPQDPRAVAARRIMPRLVQPGSPTAMCNSSNFSPRMPEVGLAEPKPTDDRDQLPQQAQVFNEWCLGRSQQTSYSAMEGELFKARPGSEGPVMLQPGQQAVLLLGSGLFHGGEGRLHVSDSRNEVDSSGSGQDDSSTRLAAGGTAAVFAYKLRRPAALVLQGPQTAGSILRALTVQCHKEVARNTVLCTLLDVVAGLAREARSITELEDLIDQQTPDLPGLDADGLLSTPVTKDQLRQLAQYLHCGPGFPDLSQAQELSISPDPCEHLTAKQMKAAVHAAWSKGTTFFEGLELASDPSLYIEHHDLGWNCPVYVAKWSQPFS